MNMPNLLNKIRGFSQSWRRKALLTLPLLSFSGLGYGVPAKPSNSFDIAGSTYTLFAFLQSKEGYDKFSLTLSDDDKDRLFSIKGYPSLDGLTFAYTAPIQLPYKSNAFSMISRGNVIQAASIIYNALNKYEKTLSLEEDFTLKYLRAQVESKDILGNNPLKDPLFFELQSIFAKLPPGFRENLASHLFIASSMIGIPMSFTGDAEKMAIFMYQVLKRSAIQIQIPIGRGFSHEDIAVINKVASAFRNLHFTLNHDPVEWDLLPADVPLLSLASDTSMSSTTSQKMQLEMLAKSRIDDETIRGLNFLLPNEGATIQLEVPYFTALSWGLDPTLDIPEQLNKLQFTYYLPGKFQYLKKIPLSLSGELNCSFHGEITASQHLYAIRETNGVLSNKSEPLFNDEKGEPEASCEFSVPGIGTLTDGKGILKIGDPRLLTALGVEKLDSPEAEQLINRLQAQITTATNKYLDAYMTRYEAAKSVKDAYIKAGLQDFENFKKLPLPEVMRTQLMLKHFRECHDETVRNCTYVAKYKYGGKAIGVRHKCWDETENKCDVYWRWVERVYTEKMPLKYTDDLNFSRVFNESATHTLVASGFMNVVMSAENKVCLSYNKIGDVKRPCSLDEIKIDQLMRQQDVLVEEGLGIIPAQDSAEDFDAPIDQLELSPYKPWTM